MTAQRGKDETEAERTMKPTHMHFEVTATLPPERRTLTGLQNFMLTYLFCAAIQPLVLPLMTRIGESAARIYLAVCS